MHTRMWFIMYNKQWQPKCVSFWAEKKVHKTASYKRDWSSSGEIDAVFHKLLAPKRRQRNLHRAKPQPAPVSVPGHNKNNMSCFWPPRNLQKSCNRQSALPHQMVRATLFMLVFPLHFVFLFLKKETITIALNFLALGTQLRETICYWYGQTDRVSLAKAKRWRNKNCSKCRSVKRSTWIVPMCLLLR